MNNNKWIKHLMKSIIILSITILIAVIFSNSNITWIYIAITFIGLFDMIYFFISLIMCFNKLDKNKKNNQTQNIRKYNYDELKNIEVDIPDNNANKTKEYKQKKKFVFKTSDDRIYEEAVKYFGKAYVKNRSKAEVIEEYLHEDKS